VSDAAGATAAADATPAHRDGSYAGDADALFDGSDDFVSVPDSPDLCLTGDLTGDLTGEA
jgi:hypothetical protein